MVIPESLQTNEETATSTNLLRRVVDGDQVAWQRFVDLYSSLIYAKCRGKNISPHDAADVVQDVFGKVHHALVNFQKDKPEHGFRKWLQTIARNVIIDHFRSQKKQPQLFGGNTMAEWIGMDAALFNEETDFSLADGSSNLMMRRAMESIKDEYESSTWQAFWRTTIDGQPATAVAEELGITHGSVRQAKYKILRRLRLEFEGLL